jgi:EAL domain-containing protein (putative c-di-GMP-specific phosphodiesterase class I)
MTVDRRIDRLTAWYQPIVELDTGAVTGFEALIRRREEDGSIVSAGQLIQELEQEPEALYALIHRVLGCVRHDLVPLFERHRGFYVSINIPPPLFGTGRIAPMIEELGLTPWLTRMVVELTERQVLSDLGRTAIDTARSIGIRVAVDDFGTGHSGLAQIVGLDLDILKIDRSLIIPALSNRAAARMLRGIVGLAEALRLRTVAEGVESREQAFFLRAAGLDYGQGFFWSPAVAGAQVESLLQQGFGHQRDHDA